MNKQTYNTLHVTKLDEENRQRLRTHYGFVVSSGALSHCAFYSLAGLQQWAAERGLSLPQFSNDDSFETGCIGGAYSTVMHMDEAAFYAVDGQMIRVLSNGEFTLGIVERDPLGHCAVHYLNPNVRTRPVFPYKHA